MSSPEKFDPKAAGVVLGCGVLAWGFASVLGANPADNAIGFGLLGALGGVGILLWKMWRRGELATQPHHEP